MLCGEGEGCEQTADSLDIIGKCLMQITRRLQSCKKISNIYQTHNIDYKYKK